MKPPPFRYVAPTSLDDALQALADGGPEAKVLAGGQSLVPLLNMRLAHPSTVVDINRITELDTVEVGDEAVVVGATARHSRVVDDPDVATALPLLRQALSHVAHRVIRNRGTCVGSLVHADPAAELPAVLALTRGTVQVVGPDERRDVAADEFFAGPMESTVGPGEIAVSATFPRFSSTTTTAVEELARRHGDYAMAGVAVAIDVQDGEVADATASFIAVTDVPRVVDLGADLAGQAVADLDTSAAVARGRGAIQPGDDIHATADYRRHLAGVLLDRALREAAVGPAPADEPAPAADEEAA